MDGGDGMKYWLGFVLILNVFGCVSGSVVEDADVELNGKEKSGAVANGWSLWNTYYYVSAEPQTASGPTTTLYSSSCQPIAEVSASYSDRACIEGTGRLKDGRMVNYASTCNCGRPCPTGGTVCWSVLDTDQFPWGKGARNNPLSPMRSLAVDRTRFQLGTTLYIPLWQGVDVPSMGGVNGFVHDGCFRADDVGGAIRGVHIDIFTGPRELARYFEGVVPTRTNMQAQPGGNRCAYLVGGSTPAPAPQQQTEGAWLGSSCEDHSVCAGTNGPNSGYCHKDPRSSSQTGICTASCISTCPDRFDSAQTFCVAASLLGGNEGGYCVAQAEPSNGQCAQLPGFESSDEARFLGNRSGTAINRAVCLPQISTAINERSASEPNADTSGSPPPRAVPVEEPCGSLDYLGRCSGDVAEWCEDGHISSVDCANQNQTCGYVDGSVGYYCMDEDQASPSNAQPDSAPPPPRAVPVEEPCGSLDYLGRCSGDFAEWCDDGQISRVDCAGQGQTCGYVDASVGYYCMDENQSSPSNGGNGGICIDPSLELSDHAEPCPGAGENTWRCACSERYGTVISQVCRGGSWTTYQTNPNDCSLCDGRYTAGCDGD
jgi:3D (Asp-Asp-Asp) domain-containing protein